MTFSTKILRHGTSLVRLPQVPRRAGGHKVFEPEHTEWGTRRARVLDPEGGEWSLGTYEPGAR
jgi:uncharacterized glyoxalase superfamily protein PhnB